jgi:hypothetical protein
MWKPVYRVLFVTLLTLTSLATAGNPSVEATAEPTTSHDAEAEKVEAFSATFSGRSELSDALEAAIVSGETDVMRALAVSREEFRDLVWPTLPIANRPKSNFTWEFVWQQHELRHESSLRRIATDFGGQDLEIVSVEARGKTTDHGSFRIHRENYVEVVRPDGTREELRLFGSLLETDDGRVKIYSFINE